jgi:ABC-2 type transport system ATP-binding protein
VISVDHLSKRYGSVTAVDDLSFEVREGEVLGLLGPNGAGKTTTLRMVTGFLPPSKGRVSIGGFDLLSQPVQAKRKLGYLPEQPPLYPEMTVRRYLGFVAALKDVPPRKVPAAVGLAMKRTRLEDVAGSRIATLSKGFRQRVGLAQAIVHEPPVLVLDEPTSSLDPKQRVEVRELIASLRGRHTVILSTHILPEVSDVADRVVIIHHGRTVAVDTPARLGERLGAGRTVRVEIRGAGGASGPSPGDVRSALAGLPGVSKVSASAAPDGTLEARVETGPDADVRPDIAALVVARGWRLLGLTGEPRSLEDVFLALTGGGEGPA